MTDLYSPSSIVVLFTIFPLLGLATLGLRFHVRLNVQKPSELWVDDWLILVGAILAVSLNVNGLIATIYGGLGRHTQLSPHGQPIPTPQLRTTLHAVYPQDVIEKVTYGLVKLSILFFYRRIFRVESFKRINTIIIAVVGMWAAIFFVVTIFECGFHPEVQWASPKAVQDTTCLDIARLLLCFAITDVITDFCVLILPIREVWRLQMSTKKKYALTFIFGLGALSTAAGIVRFVLVVMASNADFGASSDTLGKITPPFVWTNLEVSIGVIAASLPTLGPLWKAYRESRATRGRSLDLNASDSIAAAKQRMRMDQSTTEICKLSSGSGQDAMLSPVETLGEWKSGGGVNDTKALGSNDSLV